MAIYSFQLIGLSLVSISVSSHSQPQRTGLSLLELFFRSKLPVLTAYFPVLAGLEHLGKGWVSICLELINQIKFEILLGDKYFVLLLAWHRTTVLFHFW